jgi:hypothetical protein
VDVAQRLREVVFGSLDQERDAEGLARNAYRIRTQFHRVFRAIVDDTAATPGSEGKGLRCPEEYLTSLVNA